MIPPASASGSSRVRLRPPTSAAILAFILVVMAARSLLAMSVGRAAAYPASPALSSPVLADRINDGGGGTPLIPWSPSRELERLARTRNNNNNNNKLNPSSNRETEVLLVSDRHPHNRENQVKNSTSVSSPAVGKAAAVAATTNGSDSSVAARKTSSSTTATAKSHVDEHRQRGAASSAATVDLDDLRVKKYEIGAVMVTIVVVAVGAMTAVVVVYCRHLKAMRARMFQAYRYSTLEQKEFDEIVDTCDEDDGDTSETPIDVSGPPTLEVRSRNVTVSASGRTPNGIARDGTADMTSAAALSSLMSNGALGSRSQQGAGDLKQLLELDSDEELIH